MEEYEIERFRSDLLSWSRENYRDFEWREPDRSLYEVFVAEFFLTQTPAENVATVYPKFLEQFPSLADIEAASRDDLIDVIEPLGFYNMRSEALKQIADENENLPETPEGLIELPRVGRYVANATLCFSRGEPLPILDRNIERVYSRVFESEWPETDSEKLRFTRQFVPDEQARRYNLALLDFGAALCRPEPLCDQCFANSYCGYYRRQR